jgi:protein-disulfide isomerase
MHIRTQGFRSFDKRMLRTLLACVTVSFLSAAAAIAQQSSSQKQSEDVVTLKNDVQQLKAQQQLILDRLDELKKLLNSKRGDNPQLAIKVPDTVGVDGERFRGEATATVAIIEYGDIECPFCRRFKQDIYPRIVDDYIRTGKARFYYRDMPLTFTNMRCRLPGPSIAPENKKNSGRCTTASSLTSREPSAQAAGSRC